MTTQSDILGRISVRVEENNNLSSCLFDFDSEVGVARVTWQRLFKYSKQYHISNYADKSFNGQSFSARSCCSNKEPNQFNSITYSPFISLHSWYQSCLAPQQNVMKFSHYWFLRLRFLLFSIFLWTGNVQDHFKLQPIERYYWIFNTMRLLKTLKQNPENCNKTCTQFPCKSHNHYSIDCKSKHRCEMAN